MAVDSPISPADGWFLGEDKTLSFRVTGDITGIATWQLQWTLYDRNAPAIPLITRANTTGVTATAPVAPDTYALINVTVPSALTSVLDPDAQYGYVLQRIDLGAAQILAYGTVILRSAVLA